MLPLLQSKRGHFCIHSHSSLLPPSRPSTTLGLSSLFCSLSHVCGYAARSRSRCSSPQFACLRSSVPACIQWFPFFFLEAPLPTFCNKQHQTCCRCSLGREFVRAGANIRNETRALRFRQSARLNTRYAYGVAKPDCSPSPACAIP